MNPIIILSLATAFSAPLAPCEELAPVWMGPGPGESVVLAEATGETFTVSTIGPSVPGSAPAYELVVVEAVKDVGGGYVGPLIPGDTIWVVPRGRDADCNAVPWSGPGWVEEGAEVVLRAHRVEVFSGRRVIEVPARYVGYPHAVAFADGFDGPPPPDPATWLSPRDYLRLIADAPRPGSDESREDQLKRFEDVYRAGPTRLLRDFPGPALRELARRWAEEGRGRGPDPDPT